MLKLYDHPLSPYAQKVRIALREKGQAFEALLPTGIGVGGAAGEFVEANYRAEVPALIDGDVRIFDSTIILEYIEDKWPEPPLLPASPAERARVRMIEEVMDTHYEAVNWAVGEVTWFGRAKGEKASEMLATISRQIAGYLAWLERELGERPWFNGADFGWGDLSVVPYVAASAGFGNAPSRGSRLSDWLARCLDRESVKVTVGESAGFNRDASDLPSLLEQGLFKREYRDHRLEWMMKSGGVEIVLEGLKKGNIRFTPDWR
jgi:glutathione S-transferase